MTQLNQSLGSEDQEQEAAVMDVEALLSQELSKVASAKTQAVDVMVSQMQGVNLPQRVASTLDTSYEGLIGKNEYVAARLAPGDRILSQKNQRTVVDPKTNETVIVAPRPEYMAAMTVAPIVDKNVAEAVYNRTNPKMGTSFDIQESLRVLNTLSGQELLAASNMLRTHINVAIANEHAAVRQQAAIQSGALEAETNLNLNKQMDQQAGYIGISTAQTIQAQSEHSAALINAGRLELSLVASSPRLAELMAAKEVLNRTEEWRGKHDVQIEAEKREHERQEGVRGEMARERAEERGAESLARFNRQKDWETDKRVIDRMNRDVDLADAQIRKLELAGYTGDRADARVQMQHDLKAKAQADKAAALRSVVPDQQLTNYRIVYGTSGDDMKDRENIVTRRTKDKKLAEVVGANDTTIYSMLASDDNALREAGIRLVDGYDKLLNAQNNINALDLKNQPETETAKIVRKSLELAATPTALLLDLVRQGVYTKEDAARYRTALTGADAKSTERIRTQLVRDHLNATIAAGMQDRFLKDVRLWRTSETAGGPLKDAILKVRTKDGRVPMEELVETFIVGDYKDESGATLTTEMKAGILNRAIYSAVENGYRSSLFPKQAADALKNKLAADIQGQVTMSKVNKFFTPVTNAGMPGAIQRYMRERSTGIPQGGVGGATGDFGNTGSGATGEFNTPTEKVSDLHRSTPAPASLLHVGVRG